MSLYDRLISVPNLRLAWHRILTGRNIQHKRYFRSVYLTYELALEKNLNYLHERLRGDWTPSRPDRVFLPKPSGLLRPLTLLSVEDQIVYQAVANLFAEKVVKQRRALQGKLVFSNWLPQDTNGIHFLRNWIDGYTAFRARIGKYLRDGYQWTTQFDLAAYYETISHRLLLRVAAPRDGNREMWGRVQQWLSAWAIQDDSTLVDHGIPQGPIASDFLADAFLASIDRQMDATGTRYLRYVDDIRILGKTEDDVREAAIRLDMASRQLGLIPQSEKFFIKPARTLSDVLGSLPSITDSSHPQGPQDRLSVTSAERMFSGAVKGRPPRIINKSRVRFVLFRAPKSPRLLGQVIRLFHRHPEHSDAFAAYFGRWSRSARIQRCVTDYLLSSSPYDYVRGHCWSLVAKVGNPQVLSRLLPRARFDMRSLRGSVALHWGLATYFIACRAAGVAVEREVHWLVRRLTPLGKSVICDSLDRSDYAPDGLGARLFAMGEYQAGLAVISPLIRHGITIDQLNVDPTTVPVQVQNVLAALSLAPEPDTTVDQVGDILAGRFGVVKWRKWRDLLGKEYQHALTLLIRADNLFRASRSEWLRAINAFNDVLVRRLIQVLMERSLLKSVKLVDKRGEMLKLGQLLQPNQPFGTAYPLISAPLFRCNDRRNTLPESHAYQQKTGARCRALSLPEQRSHRAQLGQSYAEMVILLDPVL